MISEMTLYDSKCVVLINTIILNTVKTILKVARTKYESIKNAGSIQKKNKSAGCSPILIRVR